MSQNVIEEANMGRSGNKQGFCSGSLETPIRSKTPDIPTLSNTCCSSISYYALTLSLSHSACVAISHPTVFPLLCCILPAILAEARVSFPGSGMTLRVICCGKVLPRSGSVGKGSWERFLLIWFLSVYPCFYDLSHHHYLIRLVVTTFPWATKNLENNPIIRVPFLVPTEISSLVSLPSLDSPISSSRSPFCVEQLAGSHFLISSFCEPRCPINKSSVLENSLVLLVVYCQRLGARLLMLTIRCVCPCLSVPNWHLFPKCVGSVYGSILLSPRVL